MSNVGSTGNVIAALCNVFIPGLGHLIQGRFIMAIFLFVFIGIGYFFWIFIIPAIIAGLLHLYSILSAATFKPD